jgi:hypothetical protein
MVERAGQSCLSKKALATSHDGAASVSRAYSSLASKTGHTLRRQLMAVYGNAPYLKTSLAGDRKKCASQVSSRCGCTLECERVFARKYARTCTRRDRGVYKACNPSWPAEVLDRPERRRFHSVVDVALPLRQSCARRGEQNGPPGLRQRGSICEVSFVSGALPERTLRIRALSHVSASQVMGEKRT